MFNFKKTRDLELQIQNLRERIEKLESKVCNLQDATEYSVRDLNNWYPPHSKPPVVTYTPRQMFDLLFNFLKIKPTYKESSISLEKKNGRP